MRQILLIGLMLIAGQRGAQVSGTIRGNVTLTGQSEGAAGFDVRLLPAGAGTTPAATASTDRSGRFEFRAVPAGRYVLRVERDGYLSTTGITQISSAALLVAEGSLVHDVSMRIVKGGVISGKLRDANGRPIVGMGVIALRLAYQDGRRMLATVASGNRPMTDDQGEYRLYWLGPGEYYIRAATDGGGRGRGVSTSLNRYTSMTYFPGTTSGASAVAVNLLPGQELQGVDFSVPFASEFTISGKVVNNVLGGTSAGGGPQRLVDQLYLVRTVGTFFEQLDAPLPGRVTSGDVTTFSIPNVTPGLYEVAAMFRDQSVNPPVAHVGRAAVEVRDRSVEDVVVTISSSRTMKGRLIARGAPSNFQWPAGAGVQLRPVDVPVGNAGAPGRPTADGSLEIASVAEGRYRILVGGLPSNTYIADLRYGAASAYDSGMLTVDAGPLSELQVTVAFDAATIRGTVRDAGNRPHGDARVVLVPQPSRRQNAMLYRRAVSGANGSFTLAGVAPGEYKVFAWETLPTGADENAEFLSRYEMLGISVSVRAGVAMDVQIPLIVD